MNSGRAFYLHAALYEFDLSARQKVIGDFNKTYSSRDAQCAYDLDDHIFTLECPSSLGVEASDYLAQLIKRSIADGKDEVPIATARSLQKS